MMHRHIYWQAMPTRLPAGGLYYLCCFSCIGTSDCCSYGQYGEKLAQMIMQGRQLWYGSLQDRAESRAAACWQEDAGMAGQTGAGRCGWVGGGKGARGVAWMTRCKWNHKGSNGFRVRATKTPIGMRMPKPTTMRMPCTCGPAHPFGFMTRKYYTQVSANVHLEI